MHRRLTHPISAENTARSRIEELPGIPRTSGFVSIHLISNALAHILALALHRDSCGVQRPGQSSGLLAAAIRDGMLVCDPLALPWIPPMADADAVMTKAWGTKTGHEGERHRHLRAAATGLLAAWAPGAEVKPERPRHGRGRCVRPDLEVRVGKGRVLLAEVGVVEGDAVAALLLPGPSTRGALQAPPVTHVAVLPFAGQRERSARGYIFRLASARALDTPTGAEIRAAWTAFARRTAHTAGSDLGGFRCPRTERARDVSDVPRNHTGPQIGRRSGAASRLPAGTCRQ